MKRWVWRGVASVAGVFAWAAAAPAFAQSDWARVAVPTYNAAQVMRGLHRYWTAPRADEFAAQATALSAALQPLCDAPPTAGAERLRAARVQWRATATAWERLSAVAVGPLIERRSQRQIDFAPTRPALIEKAIAAGPQSEATMERVGTPAKGLPALEWLLWTRAGSLSAPSAVPACRYAGALAADVEREAQALKLAFHALAEHSADEGADDAAVAGMNEFINQWIGGIERLRWAQMEKPLRAGAGASAKSELPRHASGSTATSWAASWQALRSLAVFAGGVAPEPGAGLVPVETFLRGRGLNPLADRLRRATEAVDQAMARANPAAPSGVLAATRQLAALKRLAEGDLASALEVNIGFSDADGD